MCSIKKRYYWFLFFASFTFVQISFAQETTVPEKEAESEPIPAKKKNKNRYYISQSRQKSEMVQTYPFDIKVAQMDSSEVLTSDLLKSNGKPTVLAFWLTTCYPCRIELNDYAKQFEAWQADTPFNLYAVSIDFPDRYDKIKKFVDAKEWPFPFIWDVKREFKEVLPGGLNGLPQVFLFDKDGNLVYQHKKYLTGDDAALFEEVKKAAKK